MNYSLDGLKQIEETNILLSRLIGKGAFGEVFEGKLVDHNLELNVAVKVCSILN